jgi:hypothetical protein
MEREKVAVSLDHLSIISIPLILIPGQSSPEYDLYFQKKIDKYGYIVGSGHMWVTSSRFGTLFDYTYTALSRKGTLKVQAKNSDSVFV